LFRRENHFKSDLAFTLIRNKKTVFIKIRHISKLLLFLTYTCVSRHCRELKSVKKGEERAVFFPQENWTFPFLTLFRIKCFFFFFFFLSEDDNILKSYYMLYSKQSHKSLESSDKKKVTIFLSQVKRNSVFKNLLWERPAPFFYR